MSGPDLPAHVDMQPQALLVEELTDAEVQTIAVAEIPLEHRYYLSDIDD
jgi:hypothetical protein